MEQKGKLERLVQYAATKMNDLNTKINFSDPKSMQVFMNNETKPTNEKIPSWPTYLAGRCTLYIGKLSEG